MGWVWSDTVMQIFSATSHTHIKARLHQAMASFFFALKKGLICRVSVPLLLSLYLLVVILCTVIQCWWCFIKSSMKCSPRSLPCCIHLVKLNLTLMAEHHYRVTQQYGGITAIKQSKPLSRSVNRNMNHVFKINVNKRRNHKNHLPFQEGCVTEIYKTDKRNTNPGVLPF